MESDTVQHILLKCESAGVRILILGTIVTVIPVLDLEGFSMVSMEPLPPLQTLHADSANKSPLAQCHRELANMAIWRGSNTWFLKRHPCIKLTCYRLWINIKWVWSQNILCCATETPFLIKIHHGILCTFALLCAKGISYPMQFLVISLVSCSLIPSDTLVLQQGLWDFWDMLYNYNYVCIIMCAMGLGVAHNYAT